MIYSTWESEKAVIVDRILNSPGKYVIEIGSFQGCTSKVMAEACAKSDKHLICIDPWAGEGMPIKPDESMYQIFLANMEPYKDLLTVIRKESHLCVSDLPKDIEGNLAVAFIDGNHFYPHPFVDMLICWPLLTVGGAVILHDIFDAWHSRHIKICLDDFLASHGQGRIVHYQQYIPTETEIKNSHHGVSGLAWIVK